VASADPTAEPDLSFTLDEALLKRRREASERRLQTVQIPLIRTVGFVILCVIAALQDSRAGEGLRSPALMLLIGGNLAYAAASWWVLRVFYGRTGRFDLGLLFFHLDIVVWLPNLQHLERSQLFFAYFMLVRVVDQVGFGFRRAFYFAHVVPLVYLAYAGWAARHDPADHTADRGVIAAVMYLLGAYLAFTAAITERLRNRTRQAVRTARELIGRLEQKTGALEAQAVELDRARRDAEQASVAKSQFLATISHEIRTPLNGVLGTTELLLDTPLSPSQRRYAETTHRSARSLLALVDDVLDLARIEAGRLVLQAVAFDLRALVEEAVDLMTITARGKPVSVASRLPRGLPARVEGDPLRLRQLLLNLLHNAVKFTDHGRVALEVHLVEETSSHVRLRFEVSDTGIGIREDQLDSVFDVFTQADGSSTRRHGGSGLGLAIVRQLAELMGGRVEVQSQFGEGSLFTFEVRLRRVGGAAVDAGGAPAARAVVGRRVLLAEDDPVNQLVVTEMLEKLGCVVDVAEDGDAACRHVARTRYDLVFMDCHMPRVDGYQATERIRRSEASARARVPIVALTADALTISRERCAACGMDDYLTKPVTFEVLSTAVERWSRTSAPPAAASGQRES
jgi:signal transduction histidine kinase/ActR/RegA family two-component response regulator